MVGPAWGRGREDTRTQQRTQGRGGEGMGTWVAMGTHWDWHGDTVGRVQGHGEWAWGHSGEDAGDLVSPWAYLQGLGEIHLVDEEGDKVPGGDGPCGHQLCPVAEEPQLQGQCRELGTWQGGHRWGILPGGVPITLLTAATSLQGHRGPSLALSPPLCHHVPSMSQICHIPHVTKPLCPRAPALPCPVS